jgi:hypothetical protein
MNILDIFTDHKTIRDNGFVDLNKNEKQIFEDRLSKILKHRDPQGKIVYRGQKKSSLKDILVKCDPVQSDDCEYQMYENLFFFGEKAKHFYCQSSKQIQYSELFERIAKELKKTNSRIKNFIAQNSNFHDYFSNKVNGTEFSKHLSADSDLAFYYLAFLHTLGKRDGYNTCFLSSSGSYKISKKFSEAIESESTNNNDSVIIIYSIPVYETCQLAVQAFKPSCSDSLNNNFLCIENKLTKKNLPVINNDWVYNCQGEYSLVYGMFPHLILCVIDFCKKIYYCESAYI